LIGQILLGVAIGVANSVSATREAAIAYYEPTGGLLKAANTLVIRKFGISPNYGEPRFSDQEAEVDKEIDKAAERAGNEAVLNFWGGGGKNNVTPGTLGGL
jgi:hypothetical protein